MKIKNRNLFRLTRFVLLTLPKLLRFFARFRTPAKRLLIIKTDAIGDYILFRNFIGLTKQSVKYRNYEIHLLGNLLWEDVCQAYDKQFLTHTYFIKPNSFYEAPLNTLKLGWRLFLNNYEVVLQPAYTRVLINDGFAALAAAKHTIGFGSDNEAIAPRYKRKTDKFYSIKLPLPQEIYHEFHRNKFFFENVLSENIALPAPAIKAKKTGIGIVIHPGAGEFKRGWQKEKFLELIELLIRVTTQPIYLVGGPSEAATADYLLAQLPGGRLTSYINKTSLPETLELIAGSALFIGNDTGAIHMAAATETPSVCIVGGGHFNRFVPYPDDAPFKPVCVYEKLPCYYCNWECIFDTAPNEPFPCVAAVSLESAWRAILPVLPT